MRERIEKVYNWMGIPSDNYGPAEPMAWCTAIVIIAFIIIRIGFGMNEANQPEKCEVESIGDVLLSPAYALGCNISKKRFHLHLN